MTEPLNGLTEPVVLFDGVCDLCDRSVQFVIRNDPDGVFLFSPLQSEYAQERIESLGIDRAQFDPEELNTFIVVVENSAYFKSDAWIQIFRRLSGTARWLAALRFVPRPVRDAVYGYIGDRRYQWFGRKPVCMVPSPDVERRFRFDVNE
jgi:predicted DCC family thiol-disulfide oxidoreductase YuxK